MAAALPGRGAWCTAAGEETPCHACNTPTVHEAHQKPPAACVLVCTTVKSWAALLQLFMSTGRHKRSSQGHM